ncbi:MAG TPA: radical SAM protein [Coriobacteriia bacterium]|nr:radical SAM protein [Coriobacteriia bacterium]
MLTTVLRAALAGTLKPFVFESSGHSGHLDLDVPNLGAYVHIPFCVSLCPFCPYYKVRLGDGSLMSPYVDAVIQEIDASLDHGETHLSSVYFGGGSPALAGDGLGRVIAAIKARATVDGGIGVELHPRDVGSEAVSALIDSGVTMASLGVQSFSERSLKTLGRPADASDSERALRLLAGSGFSAVDVDLIFGIPGQSDDDLRRDFARAVQLGATQVSTYPFIDFSYAHNKVEPAPESRKKALMSVLLRAAEDNGFERGSVWTFRRRGTPAYSSITRDNFIGFGASATTLLRDQFKLNTFSVDGYIDAISKGHPATAYTLRFSPRSREAYWLFWSCYNMDIRPDRFRQLFGEELERDFGLWLNLGRRLGIVADAVDGYTLTSRGAYLYHVVEQIYTHQYIDRTWRASMAEVRPPRIVLW